MKATGIIRRKSTGIIAILFILMMTNPELNAQKSLNSPERQNLSSIILKSMNEISIALERENVILIEKDIPLEDWMINLEKWAKSIDSSDVNKTNSTSTLSEQDLVSESELEMEAWMFEKKWNVNTAENEQMAKKLDFNVELELESWMTSPVFWMENHHFSQR